jgi:transketolase
LACAALVISSTSAATRARVAVEAAVELGWERYIGLEGRFVGMHSFGASGKIADVYKKFGINAGAVVRAAHETLALAWSNARASSWLQAKSP